VAHMTPTEMTARHATSDLFGTLFSTHTAMIATITGMAARMTCAGGGGDRSCNREHHGMGGNRW
jgi:hypothetical protein